MPIELIESIYFTYLFKALIVLPVEQINYLNTDGEKHANYSPSSNL